VDQLSAWARFGFSLSFLLTTVVFVVFLTAVFRTFRKLHKLNRARAGVAIIVGLVCSAVVLVFIVEPLL
jgi:TM2 domain-containing membrane protein YozV